jgi:type II secretory pathway component PulL
MVDALVLDILDRLAAVRLDAIWLGDAAAALTGAPPAALRIELLVRDTPLHRRRVGALAARLGAARVPLSDQVRALALTGAARPIDVLFGRAAGASYGSLRARARSIDVGGRAALIVVER